MKEKLIPENRDSNLIFESGVQRRFVEPDLELPQRVAINAATRELKLKDDDLSLLKVFQGRANADSPMGGVLELLTNSVNVSSGRLFRVKFSGTITPSITSSNGFSTPTEGYIQYENSSQTNATLLMSSYRRDFTETSITLTTGQAVLFRFTVLNGKLMIRKVALFVANVFPNGTKGALVITNGQTHTILAGQVHDYSSIDINAGGTLLIDATATAELTQIYCTGNFINNGTIVGRRVGNGGTFTRITGTGESIPFTITQNAGGAGQNGNGTVGGSGANGFGGGGGGGSSSAAGGNGGSGGAGGGNGGSGTRTAGGRGGVGNWSLGVGDVNRGMVQRASNDDGCDAGHGGGSGGGGGGGGSERKYSSDTAGANSGSGGGYKGQHGIGLYLYIKGTVSGSGVIDLAGTNGFNGANNVHRGYNGYGGAGGGGAGGSGGSLIVRDVGNAFGNNSSTTQTSGKIWVKVTGGAGGIGGTRTYSAGGKAGDGSSGANGTYTRQGIV